LRAALRLIVPLLAGWQGNWIRRELPATENPVTRFPLGKGGAEGTKGARVLGARSFRLQTIRRSDVSFRAYPQGSAQLIPVEGACVTYCSVES